MLYGLLRFSGWVLSGMVATVFVVTGTAEIAAGNGLIGALQVLGALMLLIPALRAIVLPERRIGDRRRANRGAISEIPEQAAG